MPTKQLRPIKREECTIRIEGTTPMIMNAFGHGPQLIIMQKYKMRQQEMGREAANPEAEAEQCVYRMEDTDAIGFPCGAVKKGIWASANYKENGVAKGKIQKAIFVLSEGFCKQTSHPLTPVETPGYKIQQDLVRVGPQKAPDLRWRPVFREWAMNLRIEFDAELTNEDVLRNLLQRTGFGIGYSDWRPEKGGDYGRFQVV